MHAYNVFRRKGYRVYCAVPEDSAVPPFVDPKTWAFRGKLSELRDAPLGFDDKAAEVGVRFNGFYLFHDFAVQRAA